MNLKEVNEAKTLAQVRKALKSKGLEMASKTKGRLKTGERRTYEVWANSTTNQRKRGGLVVVKRATCILYRLIED